MGWFFDIGQEAKGVIAVGQIATGVVAIGQLATGVIAIGQAARGFIAIGQGAIGIIAVGMGSVGVLHGTAMMGIGGRGLGLVIPVAPYWPVKFKRPDTGRWRDLESGRVDEGWLPVELLDDDHGPTLYGDSGNLRVRFDRRTLRAARDYVPDKGSQLYAHLRQRADGLVCDRLSYVPVRAHRKTSYWMGTASQLATLTGVCLAFWLVAGRPVIDAILSGF
jgi:hypothetical protein